MMQDNYTTERLKIRSLSDEDSAFIVKLLNSSGWLEYIGNRNVSTDAEARSYIQTVVDNPLVHYWVVRLQDSIPIGIITLIKRDYLEHWDIGFAFLPEYTGKGYARESACSKIHFQ